MSTKPHCTLTTRSRPSAESLYRPAEPSNVIVFPAAPSPAQAKKPRGRFLPLSLAELRDLPAPAWTIDGLLETGSIAVLYGDTNIGKSFVALDIALHIATGQPWQGRDVQPGQAVYVYTESPRGLPRRVEAWEDAHGVPASNLWVIREAPAMSNQADVSGLIQNIQAVCPIPRLIVLDTLSRTFGPGDENSAEDMAAFLNGCEALRGAFPETAVMVIHHTGKDPAKGARGSYMLVANVDTVFELRRTKGGSLVLDNRKQRNGELAKVIPLALVADSPGLPPVIHGTGQPITCLDATIEPKDKRQSQTDAAILQALADAGPVGLTFTEVWNTAGIAKQTASTAIKRLTAQGIVGKIGERYVQVQVQ